jgi:hypothetical protein
MYEFYGFEVRKSAMRSIETQLTGLTTALMSASGGVIAWVFESGAIITLSCTIVTGLFGLAGIWLKHVMELKRIQLQQAGERQRLRELLDAFPEKAPRPDLKLVGNDS